MNGFAAYDWRPIETLPQDVKVCWIAHETGTMLVAYRDEVDDWRIEWSHALVSWEPKFWQPIPAPPGREK